VRWALGFVLLLAAQAANPAAEAAREWRQANERAILAEFLGLLSLPNLASDDDAILRNAHAISGLLKRRNIEARLLAVPGAPPAVYGEILKPGATQTILFYAHYDGQPLDPKDWASHPWKPVYRDAPLDRDGRVVALPATGPVNPEWRIYARSTGDDKAPIIAILAALDALKAKAIPLNSNIKFFFEGEEEAGSPHLADIIAQHKDLLKADVWLICDGPVHQSRQQQIVFGARGITTVELTVYGPKRELHSGHYGNWAPNPAMMLARLLASMKDDNGRVLIKDFYAGIEPLSETETRAIATAPQVDRELRNELAIGGTESGDEDLLTSLNRPSLNIRGMTSARTGEQASNVIPSTATASIDMRLVKGITPEQAVDRLMAHIRTQGYHVTDAEPDGQARMTHAKVAKVMVGHTGYPAVRTSMDLAISKEVVAAAESARGPVVKLPTMGGSVPLHMIGQILNAPTIIVPIANHDNNQHSSNENLRIQNLWDGIELMAALLAM
jgi:acetylornithine deacetylase/succinyl-diaminopimelate desuccinylase-like protein